MTNVTIQKCDDDIARKLRSGGVSRLGNQYLKAAYILDQAGILPDLIRVYDRLGDDQRDPASLLDAINKAVDIGRILADDTSSAPAKPEPEEPPKQPDVPPQKPPMFGA